VGVYGDISMTGPREISITWRMNYYEAWSSITKKDVNLGNSGPDDSMIGPQLNSGVEQELRRDSV
jgi:hypothetical protein